MANGMCLLRGMHNTQAYPRADSIHIRGPISPLGPEDLKASNNRTHQQVRLTQHETVTFIQHLATQEAVTPTSHLYKLPRDAVGNKHNMGRPTLHEASPCLTPKITACTSPHAQNQVRFSQPRKGPCHSLTHHRAAIACQSQQAHTSAKKDLTFVAQSKCLHIRFHCALEPVRILTAQH